MNHPPRRRSRATPDLMAALRAGKAALHQQHARLDLRAKVQLVLELQRLCLPLLQRQRHLAVWERPWMITP